MAAEAVSLPTRSPRAACRRAVHSTVHAAWSTVEYRATSCLFQASNISRTSWVCSSSDTCILRLGDGGKAAGIGWSARDPGSLLGSPRTDGLDLEVNSSLEPARDRSQRAKRTDGFSSHRRAQGSGPGLRTLAGTAGACGQSRSRAARRRGRPAPDNPRGARVRRTSGPADERAPDHGAARGIAYSSGDPVDAPAGACPPTPRDREITMARTWR